MPEVGTFVDTLKGLPNSGESFRTVINVTINGVVPPESEDDFEERVARAIERRRRKQNG